MTNLTDREVERIIKLHISPIFISVHTTNPQLRVRMMANSAQPKPCAIWTCLPKAALI